MSLRFHRRGGLHQKQKNHQRFLDNSYCRKSVLFYFCGGQFLYKTRSVSSTPVSTTCVRSKNRSSPLTEDTKPCKRGIFLYLRDSSVRTRPLFILLQRLYLPFCHTWTLLLLLYNSVVPGTYSFTYTHTDTRG